MQKCSFRSWPGIAAILVCASVIAGDAIAPLAWQGITDIAAGRGERGPWQQNDSRFDYVDDPTVAIDERGDVLLAWVDQGRKDVFFQRIGPDGVKRPEQPLNVSRSAATFSWLPRVVIAPDAPHKVFLLWQEIIFSGGSHGGDIFFAHSQDGGATFSQPVNLSASVGGDGKGRITADIWHNGSLDLAADSGGAVYAAWTEYDGALWFSRSSDDGASFSPPHRITMISGKRARPTRAPSLAVAPDRTIYLAWTVGEDHAADIRVAKSIDGGRNFGAPRIVGPGRGYSDAPKLAVDSRGVLHLAYGESAGGPFERYHIRYTRSVDGARTFEAPREISDPVPDSLSGASFPSLAIDAAGGVYVAWEWSRDYRKRPRGLGIVVSRDGGRSFNAPALVPGSIDPGGGSNGSQQGLLMKKLAVNGAGAMAIVNSSFNENARSRVWLMRTGTAGTAGTAGANVNKQGK